jgi:hypothetical protein
MQTTEETLQQTEINKHSYQTQLPQHQQRLSVDDNGSGGGNFSSWNNFKHWMIQWRGSRRLVLVIVAIALLLDNMLLTVVGKWIFL